MAPTAAAPLCWCDEFIMLLTLTLGSRVQEDTVGSYGKATTPASACPWGISGFLSNMFSSTQSNATQGNPFPDLRDQHTFLDNLGPTQKFKGINIWTTSPLRKLKHPDSYQMRNNMFLSTQSNAGQFISSFTWTTLTHQFLVSQA